MPRFGEILEFRDAAPDDPRRYCLFVEVTTRRRGFLPPLTLWRVTDGEGHFVTILPAAVEAVPGLEGVLLTFNEFLKLVDVLGKAFPKGG